ncbi:MAG: MarR family transcriptional regulator [Cellvibrionales bacterium]|jgi:DNA-binding MarR family transcriptional regulator|nr:MarR family transcriptional regulator [Cellvibrionales bacterium]
MEKVNEVLVTLRRIIRATDLYSKQLAKNTGLTSPQMLLLQILRNKGQQTVGVLAKEMSLSQATVTTILDRLEKKALIIRERSTSDRRKVQVDVTDSAVEILKDAPLPLQYQFTQQFNDLQEWEQLMMISSLSRIAQMMDAQHIDAAPVLDVGTLDR